MSEAKSWWKDAILYQIYPRSFMDGSGDGLGDLSGISSKVELFSQFLGVNCLWLSPIHPSPDADHGYDIANYTDIDPRFGSLNDFDELIARCRDQGVRVLMDGVFNHCSNQHPWFQQALTHPQAPTRDYFIWSESKLPPNNWASVMGGSAWTWSETARASYLHSFLPQQPDLNWRNPVVVDEVLQTLRFWLDRGVSGFRLDVFNCYLKDAQLRSNPRRKGLLGRLSALAWPYGSQEHIHDRDQPELAEVLGRMRELVDEYDGVLLGETLDERLEYANAAQWVGPDRLHLAFNFGLMHSPWDALKMGAAIRSWVSDLGDNWPTWVLSNHDFERHATRWGGRHIEARMRLATMIMLCLRGTPCLYQGEEIGMVQSRIPRSRIQDPVGKRYWPFHRGRDGCRTPMQWDASLHAGFSPTEPWLPVHPDHGQRNWNQQRADPASLLQFYRSLIRLRKETPALSRGEMTLPDQDHRSILSWRRSHADDRLQIVLNLSSENLIWELGGQPSELLFSTHGDPETDSRQIRLRPHEGRIIRLSG